MVDLSGTTETKRKFVPQCLNLSAAIPYRLILDSTKCTKADLNSQQLKHFGLPLRTPEIVFPMTYTSKFLGGGHPPDPPYKELLRRSVVNRASNTTLGTTLCKKAGYAPVSVTQ